jgi:Beta-lactamase
LAQYSRRVALLVFACWTAECGTGQQIPAISAETQRHIEHVRSGLLPDAVWKNDPHPGHPLSERMAALHIPGVGVAVIHHGVIEWAQGFGVTRLGGPPVTAETMFQAGSISKPVAAMAALRLVQQGKLQLDADVNTVLNSWKLPLTQLRGISQSLFVSFSPIQVASLYTALPATHSAFPFPILSRFSMERVQPTRRRSAPKRYREAVGNTLAGATRSCSRS